MLGTHREQIVASGSSAGDREVTPASTAAAAAAATAADQQKQQQQDTATAAAASASSGTAAVATTAEEKTKSASELTAGSAVAAAVPGAAVVVPPAAAAASAAAAAAAAGDAKPKKQREITAEELRALESLTSPSSVSKEKAQLAQMKATLSESMQSAKDGIKQVRCAAVSHCVCSFDSSTATAVLCTSRASSKVIKDCTIFMALFVQQ
jgi:trimeric autotransporter adhesin